MQVQCVTFGHRRCHLCLANGVVQSTIFGQRRKVQPRSELIGQPEEVKLSDHLKANDGGDPAQVLTPLDFNTVAARDGDVEVLANAAQTATDTARLTKHATQRNRRALGVFGRLDVRCGRNFDQRKAKTVQVVNHGLARSMVNGVQFPRTVLLQTQDINAHRPVVRLEHAGRGHQRCPLESARVGTINNGFSHGLDQRHRSGVKQRSDGEGDVNRISIHRHRWLFIQLHKASVGRLNIDERAVSFRFKTSSDVNSTALATRCTQLSSETGPSIRHRVDGHVVQHSRLP